MGGLARLTHSPFLAFFVGLLTVGAAVLLWLELLMRGDAVYVIVLMLPLVFAGMVWPARRMWAVRAVELLVALILSKFLIVAVLSLAGAAIGNGLHSATGLIAGLSLLTLGICAPWALLRFFPMAELAGGAVASMRGDARSGLSHARGVDGAAVKLETLGDEWASAATAHLRHDRGVAGDDGLVAPAQPPDEPPASAPEPSDPSPPPSDPSPPPEPPPKAAPPSSPAGPQSWETQPAFVLGPDAEWLPQQLDRQP
jgi:hypothetical protein